jgi:recombination protein RecR
MLDYPPAVRKLIAALRQLPTIGSRSAERLALHLLQQDSNLAFSIADSIRDARSRIQTCSICGFFCEEPTCEICRDTRRDQKTICVVERPTDVLSLERSGTYPGLYHVLGGTLSPLDGVGPEQLRIPSLQKRCLEGKISEVVLALGHDVKGETTSLYLSSELKSNSLRVTRLAAGLSIGGSLEYADPQTLVHALQGRKEV